MLAILRLALLGICLLFGACHTKHQDTEHTPSANVIRSAAAAPSAPVPATAILPEAEVLASGESIGPYPLHVTPIGGTTLREELDDYTLVDTLHQHFLALYPAGERPRLLYRSQPRDTLWLELALPLREESSGGRDRFTVRQVYLDGRDRPQVLVTLESSSNGISSGTQWRSQYLLDLTPRKPLLLLYGLMREMIEVFPAYAALHGDTLAPEDTETGWERTLTVKRHELVVDEAEPLGDSPGTSTLTTMPAGRYRYRQGQLFRVDPSHNR